MKEIKKSKKKKKKNGKGDKGNETKKRRNATCMSIRSDQLKAKCSNLNSFGSDC